MRQLSGLQVYTEYIDGDRRRREYEERLWKEKRNGEKGRFHMDGRKSMAMKKVYYGQEGVMLTHILRLYDKESLMNYARALEIKRISGLKKDELAEKIANELLLTSVMRRRIAVFSQKQRSLLERAMVQSFPVKEDEAEDALWLNEKDIIFLWKNWKTY